MYSFLSLFRCSHSRTTFPITRKRSAASAINRTYVVCLDCGKEFDYDWKAMRMGAQHDENESAPVERLATK